jgi:hypothetical protein
MEKVLAGFEHGIKSLLVAGIPTSVQGSVDYEAGTLKTIPASALDSDKFKLLY